MSHSEKASLLSNLYALRSAAAATHQTLCSERILSAAVFVAGARDNLTEAIELLETELHQQRKERDAQQTIWPETRAENP